ncbi:MAG TPA: hypothetical protein VLX11_06715, partial [Candidatus Acidoferrales bacterium]|nr:hypothetical protein [Candidatus Acidoferrales bacterium]
MQTILGSFHPHLETALAEEILKYKDEDPLCPLLVLTPSDALRRRLKIFLTRERHLSFIHLQVLTFHQLSLKLFSEKHGGQTPLMEEDLFFEETLRHVIRAGGSETRAFAGIAERAGGCAALWQTLRDLRDGMVDPGVALEALREGHFAQRTSQRTSDLLALLATLLEFCSEKDIRDRSDLDKAASGWATTSPFLKQFRQIFYYGFYDLTQIQLDFFNAVSQQHPTTLFYPLLSTTPRHDGWTFAEHFYQRYVQGRGDGTTRNLVTELCPNGSLPLTWRIFDQEPQRQYQPPPADWCCQIFNTFGAYDEVSAVAKEILRLAGDDGLAFDE